MSTTSRSNTHASTRPGLGGIRDRARRQRALWEPSFGRLLRRPKDGWILADPMPWPQTTRDAFQGIAQALIPPPPAPNNPELFAQVEDDVRRALRYMHPLFAAGMVAMIHALDLAPVYTAKSVRRLRDMERSKACAFLNAFSHTKVGTNLVFAARMAVLSQYFDQDEVQEAIGYKPVPFMQERIALRKKLLAGQAAEPQDMIGPYSDTAAQGDDR